MDMSQLTTPISVTFVRLEFHKTTTSDFQKQLFFLNLIIGV